MKSNCLDDVMSVIYEVRLDVIESMRVELMSSRMMRIMMNEEKEYPN